MTAWRVTYLGAATRLVLMEGHLVLVWGVRAVFCFVVVVLEAPGD